MADLWRKPWLFALVAMFFLALVVSTAATRLSDPMEGALERAGYPGTCEEMIHAWAPPVPDEDNSARLVLEALEAYHDGARDLEWIYDIEKRLTDASGRWSTADAEALHHMREHLAANDAAIALLLQFDDPDAARYGQLWGCAQPYSVEDALEQQIVFWNLPKLLDWSMKDALLRGDRDHAAQSLKTLWLLYRSFGHELCRDDLVDWSVALMRATQSTRYFLEYVAPDEELLAWLAVTLEKSRNEATVQSVRKTLASRPCQLAQVRQLLKRTDSFLSTRTNVITEHLFTTGIGAVDRSTYVHMVMREAQTVEESYHWAPRLRVIPGIDATEFPFGTLTTAIKLGSSRLHLLTRDLVELDLLIATIGIERHRLGQGHYPPTLEALAPDYLHSVPRDLYHGNKERAEAALGGFESVHGRRPVALLELARWADNFESSAPPIKYRLEDDHYIVYSTGRNETDNGGVKLPTKQNPDELAYRDLVREMPRR